MFEFLQTPHGQNIANSQKMKFRSDKDKKLDILEMFLRGGFDMDDDGAVGPPNN